MLPKKFEDLPVKLQKDAIKPYFEVLDKRRFTLLLKRVFDFIIAAVLLLVLSPLLLISALVIKITSHGPVFYRQIRIGKLGKEFKIHKFRTMVQNADKIGASITVGAKDPRITKAGYFFRKTRIDEFPQLIDILNGQMSLVGARPEVKKYVDRYSDEMLATLILPPGITGKASIEFKEENDMLKDKENPEEYYINEILPIKMKINLDYLKNISFLGDIKIIFETLSCVFK